jgi:hypothetical protein
MAKPKDELRKMLESTLSKVSDDLKKGSVLNAETDEKAARYLLSEIEKNLEGPTGLPKGGPPKPWGAMSVLERWKEIAVWCLEKQLKPERS